VSKTDMPAQIFATNDYDLSGSKYLAVGAWSDLALNSSFTPYIRADLAREAMEALDATAKALESLWRTGAMPYGDEISSARAALSKLKEAGL